MHFSDHSGNEKFSVPVDLVSGERVLFLALRHLPSGFVHTSVKRCGLGRVRRRERKFPCVSSSSSFLMWAVFKVFIVFVTILFLSSVLVFWPGGTWDLRYLTRDRTHTPALEGEVQTTGPLEKSLSSSPTLCDLRDCSPPGSSVLGIIPARILQQVAISFSQGSSLPMDRTCLLYCKWILYY